MIEAGLGGRYDATNVIPSKVQVLTSVGLEHTRWLGPDGRPRSRARSSTSCSRARRSCSDTGLHPEARCRRRARSRRSAAPRIVHAGADPGAPLGRARRLPAAQLRARAGRRRGVPRRARPRRGRRPRRPRCCVPGRLQVIDAGAADAARRRPQPRRDRRARRVAARAVRPPARPRRRGRLDPRRQGRAGDARASWCRCATRSSSPAARIRGRCRRRRSSRSPASSAGRRRRSSATRAPRSRGRASWPAPTGVVARDRLDLPGRRPAAVRRARGRASML